MSLKETVSTRLAPFLIGVVVVATVVVGPFTATDASASTKRLGGLHVSGNRIVDRDGRQVVFQGVNRSGNEYACVQGWGIFDGPKTASSVAAISRWHVNAVRVLVNEDCWLGINGIKPQYAGANYRRAIVDYVQLLHRYRMYAEVSLIWAAPGADRATYQPAAPDEDHAPAAWASMAATFKRDPNVILAPWGEATIGAGCFLHGGCDATYAPTNARYEVAGMQQAVTVMRRAGYTGIIAIPGISYANDLSHWLADMPHDPLHQLVAEAHVYGQQTCDSVACFQATFAPVARRVPLLFGEIGESFDNSDCGTGHISTIVAWADAHRVGYEAWTWDAWGDCGVVIRNYAGTPYGGYGAWIHSHYVRRHPRFIPRTAGDPGHRRTQEGGVARR